jgi:hypothetical protein
MIRPLLIVLLFMLPGFASAAEPCPQLVYLFRQAEINRQSANEQANRVEAYNAPVYYSALYPRGVMADGRPAVPPSINPAYANTSALYPRR